MTLSKRCIIFIILIFICKTSQSQSTLSNPKLGVNSLREVISAMKLEEKVRMVVGTSKMPAGPPPPAPGIAIKLSNSKDTGYKNLTIKSKVEGSAGQGYSISRLGIPSLVYADGPAGLRIDPSRENTKQTFFATAFPVATLLASSWDTSLINRVGKAMGNEVKEYGVDVLLAPGMNIHRNPLTGRNFEYYSEDPVVAGKMAAAMVRGIQSNGVGTSIKHFAANNQETNRNGIDVIASERTLREIYLKGFSIAIKEGHPWTVMSSYNKINGTFASESNDLLTKILKNEWGFKGFVMTDWAAGFDEIAQMKAGNDLLMPGTPDQITTIINAVKNRRIDEKIIDNNIERILGVIIKSPSFEKYKYSDKPDLLAHAAIARKAAAEGMILLKNDSLTLPLTIQSKKIAVFGNSSYDIIVGGSGSGYVNRAYKISLVKGLQNSGKKCSSVLAYSYEEFILKQKSAHPKENFWKSYVTFEMQPDLDLIEKEAENNDIAILTIGRNSGEGEDRKLEGDYYLNAIERTLIKNVCDAFHSRNKKVVVILNIGGVIEVDSWRNQVDAILLAWQPGQEAGNSIADIICGKVNPSGKLAVTFPIDYKDVPSANNFPESGSDTPPKVKYKEGIYIGYRYYNTFKVKTAYEFGFGLSYTHFNYSGLKLNSSSFNNELSASVTITNNGKVAGKEAVQLYISAPVNKLDKPSGELKKFAKTKLLQPGESQSLTFRMNSFDLASFDTSKSSWIAEAGTYFIKIGASSTNIKLSKTFQLEKELVVEKTNSALILQEDLK